MAIGGREIRMAEVKVRDNESLDNALIRFKRKCQRSGVLSEIRKENTMKNQVFVKRNLKLHDEESINKRGD